MRNAMEQSAKFMERYGKGESKRPIVNYRHYARAPKEDNDNL